MSTLLRFKCPSCETVSDLPESGVCPNCKQPLSANEGGFVQVYRIGSPIGIAVGYGTYINGQPYGHIGNKESVRFPLPYGTYTFHFTCGMTRKCEDLTVTLSPENPEAFMKVHIVPGFWSNKIVAEAAAPSEMPEMN